MLEEIEEEIERIAMPSGPIGTSLLQSINVDLEEEMNQPEDPGFIPMLEAEIVGDDGHMQETGQAMELEMKKFDRDGFDFNFLDSIQAELATQAMSKTDSFAEDILEWTGETPQSAFKKATGRDWVLETNLRDMVKFGKLTDKERQSIVKEQTSFADNITRDVTEFAAAIPKMVTASANFVGDVGKHFVEGDSEKLERDLDRVMNIGGIALDEIAASGMAMMTRPASYMREQPLDALGWIPLAAPVKVAKGAQATSKALKAGLTTKEAMSSGVKAFKNANTLDAIKGAGSVAAKAFESLPGGSNIAQMTYNLYAGTPDEFKKLRDFFGRDKNRDIQWIEEKILQPFNKLKKGLSVDDQRDLYQALVGQLPNAALRKQAAMMGRQGKKSVKIDPKPTPPPKAKGESGSYGRPEMVPKSHHSTELPSGARIPMENGKVKIDLDPKMVERMGYARYMGRTDNNVGWKFKDNDGKVIDVYAERGGMHDGRPFYRIMVERQSGPSIPFDKPVSKPVSPVVLSVSGIKESAGRTKARSIIDEMDVSDDMVEWTYDGVPMTSSEFMFDTDIAKWNDDIIGARVHPDAPAVVKRNIDLLIDLKRKLFYEGRQQSRIKTNPDSGITNPNFLSEDMFKALASSYLPIASMANKSTQDLKGFFATANKTARQQDSIGSLGTFRSKEAYNEPAFWVPPSTKKGVDRIVLSQENFIDALELSLPRTSDVMRRYKFYQELADVPTISSSTPKKGWVKLDGGVAMERLDEFGGDIMRYGALEGQYVPKNVSRIIKSTERHIRDNDGILRRAMQQHRRFLNLLKHNKLIANFSTHAHNMIGIWNILNLEGVSFHDYFKNIKDFNKKWDDATYESFSKTGRMPKSARGFGDLNDVTDAIANVKSPKEFWDIYMRKIENTPMKEIVGLRAKGLGEMAMQGMEYGSYKILGLNGNMAKWYTATDRLARYTLYKARMKTLAKKNKMSYEKALTDKSLMDQASKFSSEAMLDYGDLPLGIQAMRESGFAPFIAYPYRATRYFIEYPLRKSKTYQATEGFRAGVEGSDTPNERLQRRSIYPDDMQEPLGEGIKTLLGYDMPAAVSTRYWTPSPIYPRETLGLSKNFGEVPELVGEVDATYLDPWSSMAKLTGQPIPDTMTSKPITDLAQGNVIEAAEEILPPYFKKMSVIERALGKDVQDKLWGRDIGLKEKALQSIGMRIIPEENMQHARDRGKMLIKKLPGEPSFQKLSSKDKMKAEGSALIQGTRGTLY